MVNADESSRVGGFPHDDRHGPSHDYHHEATRSEYSGGTLERGAQSKRLWIVLAITAVFMLAEVVGGILANSLALLADAGHMLADVGALALSVVAMRLAQRPASPERTFGYVRLEILAALVNGATLLGISAWIGWEAWERLQAPPQVNGPLMMAVAGVGLIVNFIGAALLHAHAGDNLNIRAAYLHVLGDLLGSIGAIVAGALILLTGWNPIDAVASILIAGLILLGAWRLVREATEILLEMVPRHVDMAAVLEDLQSISDLDDVHDLHVWTLTSGLVALSGHGVLADPIHHGRVLDEIRQRMADHGIAHVTFQVEPRLLHQITRSGNQESDETEVGP
ncbi:MAG: cation diffusion facilitator family transporter [Gemmatimonadota bacterium]|nr:cation diffusion facilitator family transporter [Gemmatimonadota bacterium]